jgi:flavin-dependent dehydrogenase
VAAQGFKVLVVEKESLSAVGKLLEVCHIDKELFEKLGLPAPVSGDPDYYGEFAAGSYYPPYGQYSRRKDPEECICYAHYPFIVAGLPPFLRRLYAWCEAAGVTFRFETECVDFVRDAHGRIHGARLRNKGKEYDVTARLTADCTGSVAALRGKLPETSPVERFSLDADDKMFVLLKICKLDDPAHDRPERAEHWAFYKTWIALTQEPDTVIFGVGANISFDYAETCYKRFAEAVELPKGTIIREERGTIPYRRAPYALADGGFLCLGDAACMNKWIGEGICSGGNGALRAAHVAVNALRGGAYPTRAALWAYCVAYNRSQAADFAYINATLCNAVDCSADEMQYEFENGIVFTEKAMTRLNREYSARLPGSEVVELIGKFTKGLATKKIRPRTAVALLRGIGCATLLQSHYRHFPRSVEKYEKWCRQADRLWAMTGSMADATRSADPAARTLGAVAAEPCVAQK